VIPACVGWGGLLPHLEVRHHAIIYLGDAMKKGLILLYGVVAYLAFFATFMYFIGFVGNLTPIAIDSPRQGTLGMALLVNLALVTLFGVQHSVMARKPFKRWLTRFVPEAVERSTFVLASTALLALLLLQWQPLGGVIWDIKTPAMRVALYIIYALGWVLLLTSSFVINHFDLFGLRQAWLGFRGRPYTPIQFRSPWLYRQVRHPLYLGFFLGLWAAPTMTVTHLALAAGLSAYILIGAKLEERDLAAEHPEYQVYRGRVPMFVPRVRGVWSATPSRETGPRSLPRTS
jgi:protein-S-isoprenylcysteine O-methyltransferase Ste14